ncbi:unnamed protein product [Nippostrongylus brasiliensis]|uniref:DUF5641 domain-containing protein n=1 Tax=Nippostrongylus brasiliensis TaxID=27835 RepID=A0A0N4XMP2_NIPBR|nr:unnamed protein product [Nippostrongylus brasiliensis]
MVLLVSGGKEGGKWVIPDNVQLKRRKIPSDRCGRCYLSTVEALSRTNVLKKRLVENWKRKPVLRRVPLK